MQCQHGAALFCEPLRAHAACKCEVYAIKQDSMLSIATMRVTDALYRDLYHVILYSVRRMH
jgi:hypothetical protein